MEARLATYEELSELGEIRYNETPSGTYEYIQLQYDWLYNNFLSWTMSPYQDSTYIVWYVSSGGGLYEGSVNYNYGLVRPVIVLSKSVL